MNDQAAYKQDYEFLEIWKEVRPYTMTSPERGYALYQAVRYVIDNGIAGALVECGVWRGGSTMIMLKTLQKLGVNWRPIFLFDTFEGMSEPTTDDIDVSGNIAADMMKKEAGDKPNSQMWAYCDLDTVRENIATCGYPEDNIHFIKGDVCETLHLSQTGPIALLRLDTDFHDSTLCNMEQLYPRVQANGVVIIDDYGHWRGCSKAVDGYFANEASEPRPYMTAVDYTGRAMVKTTDARDIDIERYDYCPDEFTDPELLEHFPTAETYDPTRIKWPYLRYRVPHLFRKDTREKGNNVTGLMSIEEAAITYTLARQFSGRKALEIGCHFGWTTAHIVAAGLTVDVIDPRLGDPYQKNEVHKSVLSVCQSEDRFTLWEGYSPSLIPAVAAKCGEPYNFVVIDGNHDDEAPANDAREAIKYCADDCIVVFHDMVSPHVSAGLEVFKDAGWDIRIYDTMQILGIASRGNVTLPGYTKDPNNYLVRPDHLSAFTKADS